MYPKIRSRAQLTAPDEKDDKKSMGTDLEKAVGAAAKHRKKGRVAALVNAAADGAETDPESGATPAVSGAAPQKAGADAGNDGAASKVHYHPQAVNPCPKPYASLQRLFLLRSRLHFALQML